MAAYEVPLNAPVWPFPCNWREGAELAYEFDTTIFSSESGKEQRRGRRAEPRVALSCTISALSEDEQQSLVRFVFENQDEAICFPDYARQDGAAVVNSQLLTPDHPANWLSAGAAVIVRSGANVQLRHVSAINGGGQIALSTPTTYVGRVSVFPVIYGHFSDDLSARVFTAQVAELALEVEGLPGLLAPVYRGAVGEQFDGREVFPLPFTWSDRTLQLQRETKVIDFGKGRTARFNPIKFGSRAYRGRFVCGERHELDTLAAFFMRQGGRQREFFFSTDTDDLSLLGVNGAVLRCKPTGQVSLVKNRVDRALTILWKGGAKTRHKVTAYAVVGGEAQITLDPAPALAPEAVVRLSWTPLCRFASDKLVIPFLTTSAARVELTIQTLEYLPAEA